MSSIVLGEFILETVRVCFSFVLPKSATFRQRIRTRKIRRNLNCDCLKSSLKIAL